MNKFKLGINISYPPCKKCGASHGMGIEDKETGIITPMDVCKDCMFYATYEPITKQIRFGDLPEVCDPKILQNEMSETMKRLFVGKENDLD